MTELRLYEVRYYDSVGHVVKEEFVSSGAATGRFEQLVAAGHKSVKLKTVRRST